VRTHAVERCSRPPAQRQPDPRPSFVTRRPLLELSVAKERSLREQLHIGEVDDDELSLAISSVLSRGAQFRAKEVEYRTIADEGVLSLRYRAGSVVDAIAGPAMTADLEEQLQAVINDTVLTPSGRKVWRCVMFSGRPVEGYWCFKDEFQIVPAPPEAPRPNVLLAEHPFALDLAFDDSSDFRIRGLRRSRRSYELGLVLDLVLRGGISWTSRDSRATWRTPRLRWGTRS